MRRLVRVGVAAVVPVVLGVGTAMAGEPSPQRHKDLGIRCAVDDAFNGVVTARASSWMRTKDMKNNNGARVPSYSKLKAKIEIRRWAPNGYGQWAWRNLDTHTFQTVWVERRGIWIVKKSQQPPYTQRNAKRGFWRVGFGDTTKMANPGEYVSAKYTVWLDKKPGGKAWKYQRYTKYILCPSEPGQETAAKARRKAATKAAKPPVDTGGTPTELPTAPAPPAANGGGTGGGVPGIALGGGSTV